MYPNMGILDSEKLESWLGWALYKAGYWVWGPHAHKKEHQKKYGDFRLWRQIYTWNKDEIGENPNIIYPYHFLNLQKERLSAKTTEPTYTEYTVQTGDNLWNVLDIVMLANCVLEDNCDNTENSCAGDVNGDGDWNILDIVMLANCVLADSCRG